MAESTADDEAWIEAELERELLKHGSSDDSASESGSDPELPLVESLRRARDRALQALCPETDTANVPPSFQELLDCMEDRNMSRDEDIEDAMQDAQQLAQQVEQVLAAIPKVAWGPTASNEMEETKEEKEQEENAKSDLPSSDDERRVEGEDEEKEENREQKQQPEDIHEKEVHAEAELTSCESINHEDEEELGRCPTDSSQDTSVTKQQQQQQQQQQHPQQPLQPLQQVWVECIEENGESLEVLEQHIEEHRLACIRALEHEQQEALAQFRADEKERREAEARHCEVIAMHSEELRLKEFYEAERASERHELRMLAREDRLGGRIREWDRQLRENKERKREAEESRSMGREDLAAKRWRLREREQRELLAMQAEDAASKVVNEKWRRSEETRLLAKADEEARCHRDAERIRMEASRMSGEDAQAALLRQCLPRPSGRQRTARRQHNSTGDPSAAPGTLLAEQQPEALLDALLAPPAEEPFAAHGQRCPSQELLADGAPGQSFITNSSGSSGSAGGRVSDNRNSTGARRSSSAAGVDADTAGSDGESAACTATGARTKLGQRAVPLVDPWADLSQQMQCTPSSSSRSPAATGTSRRQQRASLTETSTNVGSKGSWADGRCGGGGNGNGVPDGPETCGRTLCMILLDCVLNSCHQSATGGRRRVPDATSVGSHGRCAGQCMKPACRESIVDCDDVALLQAAAILPGLELGAGWTGNGRDIVRIELRQEQLHEIPQLGFAPQLRILILTGNVLDDLVPLQQCPLLEELSLCQNSLTSLSGMRALESLVVLRVNMNKLVDANDISDHQALRHLELSKNKLSELTLRCQNLAKLVLYRNSLTSTGFLRDLPSLTELDLGRNMLAEIDAQISDWNPLLLKLFLYENRLTTLPSLRLPLLTDLWLDNNRLSALGPLGFLPSLERLQAKSNQIQTLASPIAASPLLQVLELAFNQLQSQAEPARVVPHHPRLRRLQLNDNPFVADLMEGYRSWVLQLVPWLEELDNDSVSESERATALLRCAVRDPHLPRQIIGARFRAVAPSTTMPSFEHQRHRSSPSSGGLLGLVELTGLGESQSHSTGSTGQRGQPVQSRMIGSLTPADIIQIQRANLLSEWHASYLDGARGDCSMCSIGPWCETLTASRNALLIPYAREERRRQNIAGVNSGCHHEVLFMLQRRRDFWDALLKLCCEQHDTLTPWQDERHVCHPVAFEAPGAEWPRQRLACRIQAHWRGVLERKRCHRLRLERRCEQLPPEHRQLLTCVQARWRGCRERQRLRVGGVQLPCERLTRQRTSAATKLQALIRGFLVRRRLRWARDKARIVDLELPEVDVSEMLGITGDLQLDDPFAELKVPKPPPQEAITSVEPMRCFTPPTSSNAVSADRSTAIPPRRSGSLNSGPMTAWATPPHSAEATRLMQSTSPTSRPGSGSDSGFRRSRSMSSTANSAVTDEPGHTRGLNQVERAMKEWGFQDAQTAKMWLAAQKNRQQRPPPIPGRGAVGAGLTRGGSNQTAAGRLHAVDRGSKSREPVTRVKSAKGGKCLKAQDAIAEFKRLQVEAEESSTLEFRSGEPNLKLMRSTRSLQQQLSASPRRPSPSKRVS